MSVIAAAARELMAAGVTGDALVAALERIEAAIEPPKSAGAKRQARYRERNKASHSVTTVTSVTSDDNKERKVSVPSKEINTPLSEPSVPQSESRAVAVATRPSALGRQVSEVLKALGPQPDNAKALHDAAEAALRAAGGETVAVIREFAIQLGDRWGYIDLVVDSGRERVAIELDRRMPRAKSLTKLAAFDGYRIAVTRTEAAAGEFVGMVDEVISVPPIQSATAPRSAADPFEDFWKAYPKRDGANPKAPARKKFIAHLKSGVEADAIIAGARAYDRAEADKGNVGTAYIAQAMTWLNQRRWEDYAAPPPAPADSPEARGWRPGLPTDEELRAKYAERRKAENAAGAGPDLLAESPGVRGENGHGMVCDQAGHGGVRQLVRAFPQGGLEAMGIEATGTSSDREFHGPSAMAGMVRDGADTDGIPPFFRCTA